MGSSFRRSDGTIALEGAPLLCGVEATLSLVDDPSGVGVFVTACAQESSSRLRFTLGAVVDLERFTVCHRYEPYWMKAGAGTRLAEVPPETQSLLGRLADGRWLLIVPLVEEPFRFSLRGRPDDLLELLGETGDPFTPGLGGLAAFVAVGADPFELVRAGARAVAARLDAGRLRCDKALPDFVDRFGWCTWDAFYQAVSHDAVRAGLASFAAGGVSPRFVILDDGWQRTARRPTGEQRLTAFTANERFPGGLAATVALAKGEFGVDRFLVWHTIVGYWGGVDPEALPGYGVVDQPRQFGEGVLAHVPHFNQDWWGSLVGLVPPREIARFFDDYHGYLAAQGVDGVKVDSQAVLEAVSHRQGGRVAVTRAYRAALEGSARRHFAGRLLNCMANAQEAFYGSTDSTLLRTSIDFFPRSPASHGAHLYANAQVGVWFGEFMHPDWDMFQSAHEWGAYHAAARALSGGPVYVSDPPAAHDFALLRRLVCADGTVLRADGPALPTRDTLLRDPTREDCLLKLWNRVGAAGLVGAFNCRWSPEGGERLAGEVGPGDVPGLEEGDFAAFRHGAATVERLRRDERRPVSLGPGGWALFTFAPIVDGFAAVGLADKLNGAAAVSAARRERDLVVLELRDGGDLVAYSERRPRRCRAAGGPAAFSWEEASRTLRVALAVAGRQTLALEW